MILESTFANLDNYAQQLVQVSFDESELDGEPIFYAHGNYIQYRKWIPLKMVHEHVERILQNDTKSRRVSYRHVLCAIGRMEMYLPIDVYTEVFERDIYLKRFWTDLVPIQQHHMLHKVVLDTDRIKL